MKWRTDRNKERAWFEPFNNEEEEEPAKKEIGSNSESGFLDTKFRKCFKKGVIRCVK